MQNQVMLDDTYVYIDGIFIGVYDFNNKDSMASYLDMCKKNVGKTMTIRSDEIEGGSMDVVLKMNTDRAIVNHQ